MQTHTHKPTPTHTYTLTLTHTHRLGGLDGHKAVVSFLPADVAEGSVVGDILGDVGDLMYRMVMLEDLGEAIGRR